MSDPETPTQPLIAGQRANNAPSGGRSTRAYKVAGIAVLACALIAGQAMVAYFLLSQRSDIKSLEEQSNNMKVELEKGRSGGAPMRMHLPMNALPMLTDDSIDTTASNKAPEKLDPSKATDCQLEAAGQKPVKVPDFYPACDQRGLYKAQQCFMGLCWCVNPATGEQIPNTETRGPVICTAAVRSGAMSKVLPLPDIAA